MSQDFPREQLSRATSNYVTWTIVGGFSGRWLAGSLAGAFGWREALFGLAVANAGAGAILLTTLSNPHSRLPSRRAPAVKDFFLSLSKRPLRAVYLIGFGSLFTMVGGFTYVTFHLSASPFDLGARELGNVFFVYLLGITITPMVGSALSRWGFSTTIGRTTRLAVGGLLLTLVPQLSCVIAGLALLCVAGFGTQACASAYIAGLEAEERSVAAGLYLSAYYVGGSLGAFLPGLVWQSFGWVGCVALLVLVQGQVYRLRASLV